MMLPAQPTTMRYKKKSKAFTLLELMVTLLLFSTLSVLTWQGMRSILLGRNRITTEANQIKNCTILFGQIGKDLHSSSNIRLMNIQVPPVSFHHHANGEFLKILREQPFSQQKALQEVLYRLNGNVLERGARNWNIQEKNIDISRATVVWQPLLSSVREMRFRIWIEGQGWTKIQDKDPLLPSSSLIQQGVERSGTSITGFELTIVQNNLKIVRIFSLV